MTSHQCRRSCNGRRNTATLRCWFQNVQNKSLICIWVTMKTGMEISRRHTSPQSPTINQLSLIQFKHNTMEISWIWIFYLNPHPTVLIYIHFYLRNSLKCYLAMCKKVTKKKTKKTWIHLFAPISTKNYRGLFEAQTHPPLKFVEIHAILFAQ